MLVEFLLGFCNNDNNKTVEIINYHEFLKISELINSILFLKDTGKSWDIFYQFIEFRHLI